MALLLIAHKKHFDIEYTFEIDTVFMCECEYHTHAPISQWHGMDVKNKKNQIHTTTATTAAAFAIKK